MPLETEEVQINVRGENCTLTMYREDGVRYVVDYTLGKQFHPDDPRALRERAKRNHREKLKTLGLVPHPAAFSFSSP